MPATALCWLGTYLLLPALLVISERFAPMFGRGPTWRSRARGFYGYPFVWLALFIWLPLISSCRLICSSESRTAICAS